MIRNDPKQTEFIDFHLPFGGHLDPSNRWIKLVELTPWDVIEECYAEKLSSKGIGAPALSGRIAYGAPL